MTAVVYFALLGLALYGAYQLCIKGYMKNNGCNESEAKKCINNWLIDQLIPNRQYRLESDLDFQRNVDSDVRNILHEADYQKWTNLFRTNIRMVESGGHSGLPYWAIKLFVPNDDIQYQYESTIPLRAKTALQMHGLDSRLFCQWHQAYKVSQFKWLEIRYAITAEEIKYMDKLYSTEQENLERAFNSYIIIDEELEKEIEIMETKDIGDPED